MLQGDRKRRFAIQMWSADAQSTVLHRIRRKFFNQAPYQQQLSNVRRYMNWVEPLN